MNVTAVNYPTIFQAFMLITQDNGGINRVEGTPESWQVPDAWEHDLAGIEARLALLTAEELETLCTGEAYEAEGLGLFYELDLVQPFLDAFFNGWTMENANEHLA